VTNWAEYNESLRRRGDLTVWLNSDALNFWTAPRRMSCGGQLRYSDLAITTCLTLSVVCKLPLRQTQGMKCGVARLMGLDISVQDFGRVDRERHFRSLQDFSSFSQIIHHFLVNAIA
jgi:hypothetical protein